MNNPIADQIVDTLTNLRREVSTQGITAEADVMWQHALLLYRMRRDSLPAMPEPSFAARYQPAELSIFLRPQAG
jgi:hypothetical protein